MTLSADAHWLADPARRYPVTIDPSLTQGVSSMQGGQDCKLVGGSSAGTNFCRQQNLTVGYDGSSANRALVEMNPSFLVSNGYIPATATTTVTPTAGWVYWYPSAQMVQGWMDGSVPNNGLILKEPTETTANLLQFYSDEYATSSYWPSLQITYSFMAGEEGHYTFVNQGVHDGLGVSVNVASGNLLAQATDFAMQGIGMDVGVGRVYNSLTSSVCVYDLGFGWHTGAGETGVNTYPDGSQTFQGPSGEQYGFVRNADGSFTSPPGLDADLVRNGDGSYTLTDHGSQSKLNFTSNNLLASVTDRVGDRLSYSYQNNPYLTLASMTDTQGRTTSFTESTSGQLITQVTDPAGRTYGYSYDTSGNLTGSTDAAGKVTRYQYDSTHLLTQITTPNGLITKIAYDSSRRVTSITDVTNTSTGTGPTTTFAYNSGNTTVTDSNNHTTTYAYDSRGRVTAVTYPDNTVSHTSWTADNHVASETSPKNETTTYTYDTGNNLTQAQMPGGQSMSWAYSTAGSVSGS